MDQVWDGVERRQSLRARAEALVVSLSPEKADSKPADVLMHELLVHKIELEMQNDEWQRTYRALAELHDHYQALFEFAPSAYVVIDANDQIGDINLTGVDLFGAVESRLTGLRFSKLVADDQRDDWYRHFRYLMDSPKAKRLAFDIPMIRSDGTLFAAHLDCLRHERPDTPPQLFVLLAEVGPG
ncbi:MULTISPECIES: PAS domain S-box protein [Methylomonas]|uniref:PAS domain-containing protein n=1 Tax=Methylomonas koyamae TaxID=702114 RepID=A0A177N8S1_9GAMM|nr:PAS domain-containing protein [Methylomonas koyamae]OAI13490.1 hypothetical protein A1355_13355 [Methylomonas koyamae]